MTPAVPVAASQRTPSNAALDPRPRFPCLEGLRAVAALLVFFHHVGFLTGATFNSRIGAFLGRLDVGVPVFFAISGFLLFRPSLVATFDETELPNPRRHYIRRFFRIYPTYWVVFALIALTVGIQVQTSDAVLHVLLLQIYRGEAFLDGLSQSWSLAVEVSFYLVLPLFSRLLRSWVVGQPAGVKALRTLAVLAGLIAASNVWRVFVYGVGLHDRAVFWLPGTIDYFAIGMALATISVWGERSDVGQELSAALGRHDLRWWVGAFAVLVFVSYQLELALGLERATWHKELFRQAGYDVVALALIVPAVFGPLDRGMLRRFLQWRPIAALGAISYSFYLWHLIVIEKWIEWRGLATSLGFLDWATTRLLSLTMLEITLGSFVVTTVLSVATYLVVERPVQRWSRGIA